MADALYNAILGEETPKAVSSSSAGGGVITDQILDSLKRVESGKDKYALNKESENYEEAGDENGDVGHKRSLGAILKILQ